MGLMLRTVTGPVYDTASPKDAAAWAAAKLGGEFATKPMDVCLGRQLSFDGGRPERLTKMISKLTAWACR